MNKVIKFNFIGLILGLAGFIGCHKPSPGAQGDKAPPQVKVHPITHILADEQLKPVLDAALLTYSHAVPEYPVRITYLPEEKAVAAFLADSALTLLLSCDMGEQAQRIHRQRYNSPPQSRPLMTGAVLLVAHPQVADTAFTLLQLKTMLAGQSQTWSTGQRVVPVCDGVHSSNLHTLFRTLALSPGNIPGLYATASDSATLAYVARTPHALGIVGYEALADRQDPAVVQRLQQVKVLAVAATPGSPAIRLTTDDAVQHLAKGRYPLGRDWRILSRAGSHAAGTAFATYLTSSIGQRLVYKSGLMPADPPGRDVEIVEKSVSSFN